MTNLNIELSALLNHFVFVPRALGVAATAPGWGAAAVGWRVRICLGLLLALTAAPLAGSRGSQFVDPSTAWPAWVATAGVELALGAAMGLAGSLVIAGARQAGDLVGAQAGLAPASLVDLDAAAPGAAAPPDEPSTALAQLYGLLAFVLFLGLDGPLRLVDALGESYQALPPGLAWESDSGPVAGQLLVAIGHGLALAIAAAVPAGLALLAAGVLIAVIGRGSAVRVFAGMAWPARWALGLVAVGATLPAVASTVAAAWRSWSAALTG